MYGITETTVHVTYRPLFLADAQHCGADPIGARIPDLRIYILDQRHQPVAIGVSGGLYIGRAGVARGYLNRPGLTAERFLSDPFVHASSLAPHPRMYKTGDLGRFLPDGNIVFLGRNDFQVKIRGFRIELDEIEARLCSIDGVKEAVVLARQENSGDKRLVAYYTAGGALSAETLRRRPSNVLPRVHGAGRLCSPCNPAAHRQRQDRPQVVPAPESDAFSVRSYEAPVGEMEQRLAAIWADLLQIKMKVISFIDNDIDTQASV